MFSHNFFPAHSNYFSSTSRDVADDPMPQPLSDDNWYSDPASDSEDDLIFNSYSTHKPTFNSHRTGHLKPTHSTTKQKQSAQDESKCWRFNDLDADTHAETGSLHGMDETDPALDDLGMWDWKKPDTVHSQKDNDIFFNSRGHSDTIQSRLDTDAQELNKQLAQQNLKVHQIEPDGNCAFRAICFLEDGTQEHHLKYRKAVVELMRKNKEKFKDFIDGDFDDHLKAMSRPGEWADNVEIFAMSMLLGKKIIIHRLSEKPSIVSASDKFTKELHIAYELECHYNCVVPIEEDNNPVIDIMKLTGETNSKVIGKYLEIYNYNVNDAANAILKDQERIERQLSSL